MVFKGLDVESENVLLGAKTNSKTEFWPSILEKALCKLYSSPELILHSNPSIECFHLIGWYDND